MKDERRRRGGVPCANSRGIPLPGLRAVRLGEALSQAELGELSGVSRETIYRLEGARRAARPRTARRLAMALGVRPEDLMREHPLDR